MGPVVDPAVRAAVAREFAAYLRDNTDTFDPVVVRMALESGDPIKPDDAMIEEWVEHFAVPPVDPGVVGAIIGPMAETVAALDRPVPTRSATATRLAQAAVVFLHQSLGDSPIQSVRVRGTSFASFEAEDAGTRLSFDLDGEDIILSRTRGLVS